MTSAAFPENDYGLQLRRGTDRFRPCPRTRVRTRVKRTTRASPGPRGTAYPIACWLQVFGRDVPDPFGEHDNFVAAVCFLQCAPGSFPTRLSTLNARVSSTTGATVHVHTSEFPKGSNFLSSHVSCHERCTLSF